MFFLLMDGTCSKKGNAFGVRLFRERNESFDVKIVDTHGPFDGDVSVTQGPGPGETGTSESVGITQPGPDKTGVFGSSINWVGRYDRFCPVVEKPRVVSPGDLVEDQGGGFADMELDMTEPRAQGQEAVAWLDSGAGVSRAQGQETAVKSGSRTGLWANYFPSLAERTRGIKRGNGEEFFHDVYRICDKFGISCHPVSEPQYLVDWREEDQAFLAQSTANLRQCYGLG